VYLPAKILEKPIFMDIGQVQYCSTATIVICEWRRRKRKRGRGEQQVAEKITEST